MEWIHTRGQNGAAEKSSHGLLFRHVISLNDCLNFSLALDTAPTSVFVLVLNRIEEKTMEHHAQALLALSISAALCLGAWFWARRRLAQHKR
jgi:hypothetical protein